MSSNTDDMLDIAIRALREIAAFDDVRAQERFNKTGSFSSFDEPGSVEIARKALVEMVLPSAVRKADG